MSGCAERIAASSFVKAEWKMVQPVLTFEKPPFLGLTAEAQKRPQLVGAIGQPPCPADERRTQRARGYRVSSKPRQPGDGALFETHG